MLEVNKASRPQASPIIEYLGDRLCSFAGTSLFNPRFLASPSPRWR